jgi:UDP-N-acetylmuramoyl-tripeptide--D-alanyl-D-alanine ligase
VDGVPLPHLATQLYGRYNLPNFLAALAVGLRVGPEVATPTQTQLTPESLVKVLFKGLSSYVATNNRSQLLQLVGGKTAILDAYNANPDSMELALRSVAEVAPGRWAAVVGDMLELGPESHHLHQAVGLLLNELRPTYVVFVGNEMRAAADVYAAGPFMWASQTDNLPEFALEQALRGADTLLFKASRGTRLDTLYQWLPACQTTE